MSFGVKDLNLNLQKIGCFVVKIVVTCTPMTEMLISLAALIAEDLIHPLFFSRSEVISRR